MPGLLEDFQQVQRLSMSRPDTSERRRILGQTVARSLCRLYDLRWRWEHQFPQACYETAPSRSDTLCVDADGNLLFPTVLQFWDSDRANEIGIYNALLLLHLNILDSISWPTDQVEIPEAEDIVPTTTPGTSKGPLLLPGQGSQEEIAREICRTVDFHLHKKEHHLGALLLLFPLRVAYKVFEPHSREALWLQGIMFQIADSKGFEMGRHILHDLPLNDQS